MADDSVRQDSSAVLGRPGITPPRCARVRDRDEPPEVLIASASREPVVRQVVARRRSVDRGGMAHDHPYGDFDARSHDGRYRFEWTPFTPAVVAWRRAAGFMRTAHEHLADASTLEGFGIRGMEAEHNRYAEGIEVLLEDLGVEVVDAELIVSGLDTANRNYAAANEASHDAYRQVMGTVDAVLAHQGRPRKLPERAGGV
jgi:hypothetical protein